MKRKWFVLFAILAIAAISVFITNQVTQAQRPDRPERGDRPRRGEGPGGPRMNPTSLIESSWAGLTFAIKVDDQTLLKARPVHQKAWDEGNKAMEEARKAGDFQGMREKMQSISENFMAGLKEVLTEEQLTQLRELQRRRMAREGGRERRGGGGPGEGRRGDEGGQENR